MDTFGWLAIAGGAIAILGVVAYGVWGRTPMMEDEEEPDVDFSSYAPPIPSARTGTKDQVMLPDDERAPAPAPVFSAPVAPPAPVRPSEPAGAYLVIKTGADQGRQYPVGNAVTIGRGAGCGITLADNKVSSEHGRFKRQGDSYVYLDLKSTNGSFLLIEGREERLRVDQALVDGDELRLGGTVLQFLRTPKGDKR
jgi:hypothetical protein